MSYCLLLKLDAIRLLVELKSLLNSLVSSRAAVDAAKTLDDGENPRQQD